VRRILSHAGNLELPKARQPIGAYNVRQNVAEVSSTQVILNRRGSMHTIVLTRRVATIAIACTLLATMSPASRAQAPAPQPPAGEVLVYFGTYTGPTSKGIYVSRLNLATGELAAPQLAAETENPSFLAVHPSRDLLYAVNEISKFEGQASGSVSAYGIDRQSGTLKPLNRQPSAGGGPAHVTIDAQGRNVLVANYGGGSVAVLPVAADGTLQRPSSSVQHKGASVNPNRQKGPHAHSINLDSANRFAYAADLGIDKVMIYRYDAATGALTANDPPFAAVEPGSGPRHFAIHPEGRFAYVINELPLTITAFARDAGHGGLTAFQTISTLQPGTAPQQGYSTAEIQVHSSGRFLYGSNRGHNSIAVFSIDPSSGRLTFSQIVSTQGRTPRNFGIDPTGTYLLAANQQSDTVTVFRIDQKSGRLTQVGTPFAVPTPVCVKFVK
jgi:6-phosphogluconolactonase